MKSYKLITAMFIAGGAALLCNGCEDSEATYIANQTKHYANLHSQIKRIVDNTIADTTFKKNVYFEFAKIKEVHPLYYIACYSVTEEGRNYQAGFHVMKRNNNWTIVKVTTNWEAID